MNVVPENTTLELLLSRRSVKPKDMTGPGPDEETLQTILRAGIRVPDHGKLGPWRLLVIRGEARRRLGDVLVEAMQGGGGDGKAEDPAFERERFMRAPVVVCVVSRVQEHKKIPEWEQILSAGACCQNMLVAAHAAGYVAQWLTEWYSYEPAVHRALGLEAGDRIAGFVYIGSPPEEAPGDRRRPELREVASEWHGP